MIRSMLIGFSSSFFQPEKRIPHRAHGPPDRGGGHGERFGEIVVATPELFEKISGQVKALIWPRLFFSEYWFKHYLQSRQHQDRDGLFSKCAPVF
jgi:hypothetical protein